ncbi:MAG: iron ABC transporter permease, partial [Actinomycetota bacterium]|nr:iron ABC transporter permease [Actinomycetota bacterium]
MTSYGGSGARRLVGLAGLAVVPTAVLGIFFVLPVTGMVSRGFVTDGALDLGGVLEVLGRPRTRRVLWF